MTIKEAIQAILPFEVSESLIDKTMMDSGLNDSVIYTTGNRQAVDLILVELISFKLAEPDIVEEGLSITINRDALKQLRSDILVKYNKSTGGISDASALW